MKYIDFVKETGITQKPNIMTAEVTLKKGLKTIPPEWNPYNQNHDHSQQT